MTMTLKYAEWLGGHLLARVEKHVKRAVIAGSVRRARETVGDLEIVCEPHMNADLFNNQTTPYLDALRSELREVGRLVKNGNRYIRVHLTKTDQYADIFIVWPPAMWGSILAIRTGPPDLGKYVVTHCRELNGILHNSGCAVRMKTGEVVPTETEEQFFALANVECVPPPEREALTERLMREWAARTR